MTRQQALQLAQEHRQPIVVPNDWGRYDYALPGGITANAGTKAEVVEDLRERGYSEFLLVQSTTPEGGPA